MNYKEASKQLTEYKYLFKRELILRSYQKNDFLDFEKTLNKSIPLTNSELVQLFVESCNIRIITDFNDASKRLAKSLTNFGGKKQEYERLD